MKITNINLASKLIKNSLNSRNWSSLPYCDHGFSEDNSNIGLEEGKRKGNFWILMKNPIHHLWAPLNEQVRHLLYHYNHVDIHQFHVFQSHQRTTKFHERTDGFLGHQFRFLKDIWEPHLYIIARCSIFYITTVIYHNWAFDFLRPMFISPKNGPDTGEGFDSVSNFQSACKRHVAFPSTYIFWQNFLLPAYWSIALDSHLKQHQIWTWNQTSELISTSPTITCHFCSISTFQ